MAFLAAIKAIGLVFAADGALLDPVRPKLQAPPEETYELRRATDGSGDLVCDRTSFAARIAKDGTVRFTDKRITDIRFLPFVPRGGRPNVPSLQASLKALLQGKNPPPPPQPDDRGPPPETTTVIPETTRYRPDPREGGRVVRFDPMLISVFGRFDLTDEIVRLSGQDPHRYQKARFLAATREFRAGLAAKTHADNIRRAAAALPPLLQSIACDERLSHRDRRSIIEALRAEMDPGTADGRAAVERIDAFLRSEADGTTPPACAAREK